SSPIEKIPEDIIQIILNGSHDIITVPVEYNKWNVQNYQIEFDGIIKMLEEQNERRGDEIGEDLENFRILKVCPECHGARLKKESLHFKLAERNIFELATMDLNNLAAWFEKIEESLSQRQQTIARE